MNKQPALLLLPNLLGEHRHFELFLPDSVERAVLTLDGLISESEQGGRRYLSRFLKEKRPQDVPLALLNEPTRADEYDFLLEPILEKGERWGLVSDAGLPCIADPGSQLVFRARQRGILIQAFVGPSAILLALMQSGLPGQRFAFHGYLNKDSKKKKEQLLLLEKKSTAEDATQLFMEAPYRNQALLTSLLETLNPETLLSIAWDLTMPSQGIITQSIASWQKSALPNIDKKPAIFLIYKN